jgi:hypothetical protein
MAARSRGPCHDGSRLDTAPPQCGKTDCVISLRKPLASCVEHEGHVEPTRVGQPEGSLDKELPRGAREQVVAAQDLGNTLRRVIDDHGELIGGRSATSCDDEVADIPGHVERDAPHDPVVEVHWTFRYSESDAGGSSGVEFCLPSRRVTTPTRSRIPRFSNALLRCTLREANVLARAGAGIDAAIVSEPRERRVHFIEVRGLNARCAIPIQAEPFEVAQRGMHHGRGCAFRIEIFDAQNDATAT